MQKLWKDDRFRIHRKNTFAHDSGLLHYRNGKTIHKSVLPKGPELAKSEIVMAATQNIVSNTLCHPPNKLKRKLYPHILKPRNSRQRLRHKSIVESMLECVRARDEIMFFDTTRDLT